MLHGVPLEPDTPYRVMVTNFLAEGGDAYAAFVGGSNRAETGIRDIDALTGYLVQRDQNGKPAGTPAPQGRIQRLP
jgi:5'-nucleotidase